MPKMFITITLLYAMAICCAASRAAEALPDSVASIAAKLGYSLSETESLSKGEIMAVDLPETSDKMLAQMVAAVIPEGIEKISARLLGGNLLETDKDVIAFGRIDPAHIEESLKNALFTQADAEEISMLQNAKFENFNLSSSEIAELKSATGSSTPDAIAKIYRKILVERAKDYIGRGLTAVDDYARRKGKKTRVARELKMMAEAMNSEAKRDSALYLAFLNYPKNQNVGSDTAFFWIKKLADNRPVFTLVHRIIQSRPGSVTVMRREFFVGQSFNAAQTVSSIFPLPQGAIIFSDNRTTADRVAGFGSKLRHIIGRNMMRDEIVKRINNLRALYTR